MDKSIIGRSTPLYVKAPVYLKKIVQLFPLILFFKKVRNARRSAFKAGLINLYALVG
jgi:hypothetical protein